MHCFIFCCELSLTPPGRLDCTVRPPMVGFLSDCIFEVASNSFTDGPKQLETASGVLFTVLSLFGTVSDVKNDALSVELIVSSRFEFKFSCCLKKSSSFVSSDAGCVFSSKCNYKTRCASLEILCINVLIKMSHTKLNAATKKNE